MKLEETRTSDLIGVYAVEVEKLHALIEITESVFGTTRVSETLCITTQGLLRIPPFHKAERVNQTDGHKYGQQGKRNCVCVHGVVRLNFGSAG